MGIDAQLLVRNPKPLSPLEVRKMSRDLVAAFGIERFCVIPPGVYDENGSHALEIVDEYVQDGPTLRPANGEQFIIVNVSSRWYGKGYERGDLPVLISIAEWLELRIQGSQIWYGGDSSGVLAKSFDACGRRELFQHFVKVGHDPYSSFFGKVGSETCAFCADAPMHGCRGGPGGVGYVCDGCGLHRLVTHDGTKTEAYGHWPDEMKASWS